MKTTLLNCLRSAVPARERIVTCEEVFELTNHQLLRTSLPLEPPCEDMSEIDFHRGHREGRARQGKDCGGSNK